MSPSPAARRLEVMNFLNEVAGMHPHAISFASGRPAEQFFDVASLQEGVEHYLRTTAARSGSDLARARQQLAQYGPTAGIIAELIARQLHFDEGLDASAEQIIVTTGAQEAIDLCVQVLCPDPADVVIARSPTYIGITGAAWGNRREIVPLPKRPQEGEAQGLARLLDTLRESAKRPRVLYLCPDYSSGEMPTGPDAAALVDLCTANGIAILEDNPYNLFRFDGTRIPPISALNGQNCVLHIGTYSKSICPAVRTGFVVVPRAFMGSGENAVEVRQALVQAKSFVTVNTSQFMQAMVGGMLLQNPAGLRALVDPIVDHYRHARDTMLAALGESFEPFGPAISWSEPSGGFFLTVRLPFAFDSDACMRCVHEHGVIATPLSFFALDGQEGKLLRLAFSSVPTEQIRPGVQRLAAFVGKRLNEATGHRWNPASAQWTGADMPNTVWKANDPSNHGS